MTHRAKIGIAVGVGVLAIGLWLMARDDGAEPATAQAKSSVVASATPERRVLSGDDSSDDSPKPKVAPGRHLGGGPERLQAPASECADGRGEGCSFLEPTQEDLDEMARCGIVRYDFPRFVDQPDHPAGFDEQWQKEADLTDQERKTLDAVSAKFRAEISAEAVALAEEAGLERSWAEKSPLVVVVGMVQSKLDREEHGESLQRIADERAGKATPPPPDVVQSLSDRTARLLVGVGDRFERAVAAELGEQRAYELREAADGWGVSRSLGDRCPEPETTPVAERTLPTNLEEAKECLATWREGTCKFLEPNKLMLDEMARCGIVRFDFPNFLLTRDAEILFDAEVAEQMGMTPAEAAVLAEVGEEFRGELYSDVVDLIAEIGRSREWAESTPLMGLMLALYEEVEDDTSKEVFTRIAQERAGQLEPPGPDTPPADVHDAFVRRIVGMGPRFEKALADRLGPERARQLREHGDGWPETRIQTASQCKDEDE